MMPWLGTPLLDSQGGYPPCPSADAISPWQRAAPSRYGNPAHIRKMVRDTLMAVDAGLFAGEQKALVRNRRARRLLGDVHRRRAITAAAFQRIIGLEPRPFV